MKYFLPFLALVTTLLFCLPCFSQSPLSLPALVPSVSMVPSVTNFGPLPTNLVGIHPTPKPLNLSNIVWQAYPTSFQAAMLETSEDGINWRHVDKNALDGLWHTNTLPVVPMRLYCIVYIPIQPFTTLSNGVSTTVSNSVKVR